MGLGTDSLAWVYGWPVDEIHELQRIMIKM